MPAKTPSVRTRRAFTMVELMTVLAIIVILVTILIPVVSRVRRSAQNAATQAEISSITAAIERYHQTFSAYPGPLSSDTLWPNPSNSGGQPGIYDTTNQLMTITGAENLVLGLLGGLKSNPSGPGWVFDRALLGTGPRNLNPIAPKKYDPFIDAVPLTQRPDTLPTAPSYGNFKDGAGDCLGHDSGIPEILDRYSAAMPILYLRARVGAQGVVSIGGKDGTAAAVGSAVIGTDINGNLIPTQYDLNQILPYTGPDTQGRFIGEGKSIHVGDYTTPPTLPNYPHGLVSVDQTKTLDKNGGGYQYPYDAFPYFVNRAIPPTDPNPTNANKTGTPKQKDGYILISAGADRVYGTADDITSFGSVTE